MKTDDPLAPLFDRFRLIVREELAAQKAGAPREAPGEIINCKQVAELIDCHVGTVPKLAARRGLPVYGRVGTHLRFRRSDVLAWVARDKS